eukprot:Pgem_evm1s12129
MVVFRDAMLFRQTVSYLLDQHVVDYPYSLKEPKEFRIYGILGLYTINTLWIIAPCFSFVWAHRQIKELLKEKK